MYLSYAFVFNFLFEGNERLMMLLRFPRKGLLPPCIECQVSMQQ